MSLHLNRTYATIAKNLDLSNRLRAAMPARAVERQENVNYA
jgi:hypothetical protein